MYSAMGQYHYPLDGVFLTLMVVVIVSFVATVVRVEPAAMDARLDGAPAGVDGAPAGVDGAPAGVDGAPAGVDGAPAGVDGAPAGVDGAPAGVDGAPAGVDGAPAGVDGAPAGVDGAPAGVDAGVDVVVSSVEVAIVRTVIVKQDLKLLRAKAEISTVTWMTLTFQGHQRSNISHFLRSQCATSYWSPVDTNSLSRTVCEIFRI